MVCCVFGVCSVCRYVVDVLCGGCVMWCVVSGVHVCGVCGMQCAGQCVWYVEGYARVCTGSCSVLRGSSQAL